MRVTWRALRVGAAVALSAAICAAAADNSTTVTVKRGGQTISTKKISVTATGGM